MRTILPLAIVVFILLLLAACAGGRESAAFREAAEVEKSLQFPAAPEAESGDIFFPGDSASLNALLEYAKLHNPALQSAFSRWKSALQRVPQARALPDPLFVYRYAIQEMETEMRPEKHRLSLEQMFPWFGTLRLRADAALEEANMAGAMYRATRRRVFFEVKDAYYEYAYLARAIAVMEENVQLLRYLEEVALAKYRAGAAPHSSLIKAQVERDKLEDQLRTLADMLNPVRARLNASLNRPSRAELPPPGRIPPDTVNVSEAQWIAWLQEHNPDLKAAGFQIEREKFSASLARKSYYPDITLGVEYGILGAASSPEMQGVGKNPLMAMVGLNLPLWWGKNRAAVNEARAGYQASLQERQNRENELLATLQMALYQFRDAGRREKLYREALLPRAKQALNVTQSAFETGKVDFLDLVDAQRTYLEFQLALERARADYAQRLAELEMLAGREGEVKNAK